MFQVCDAIVLEFRSEFKPFTNDNWMDVANEFNYRWNFPNCLGAIDGKHVPIVCPANSGSLFYNYKKFYSIVLMAISDSKYKFSYVNVGAYGSEGDSGVFAANPIGRKIYNDQLPLPEETTINGHKLPFFFIADDAFPLLPRIMKPYVPSRGKSLTTEERIFNYRLSRARRCVENAFGILTRKWLCLSQTLKQEPVRASKIVLACCVLHNLLIDNKKYCPPGFADHYDANGILIEGEWRTNGCDMVPLQTTRGRVSDRAKSIRNVLKNYVNSPAGSVSWQTTSIK